jgi:integrase
MARSPFLLFRRISGRKTTYYVKIWLPAEGKYTTAKSTSVLADLMDINRKQWPPSAKAGARHIAEAWLAARGGVSRKNDPLLWEYCLAFWDWEKSNYIQGKLERGQQIGRSHCANSHYRIKEYIQPRTQGLYLSQVTAADLDRLQLRLKQELPKQSAKSINMIMSATTTPIREAYRLGQIAHNPAQNFRGLASCPKRRGILSTVEIKKLFDLPWEFEAHRLAVAVGFATGARLGEILAIAATDIDVDFQEKPVLWIRKSWSFAEKRMKGTKTGGVRVVPISGALRDDLLALARENPHDNGFIFWGPDTDKPLTARIVEWGFCKQLHNIGMDEATRKARNVSFHSLRHMFNSTLRGKVPDATLRLATGHADPGMTDNYDHLTDERLAEIRQAQEENILLFRAEGA